MTPGLREAELGVNVSFSWAGASAPAVVAARFVVNDDRKAAEAVLKTIGGSKDERDEESRREEVRKLQVNIARLLEEAEGRKRAALKEVNAVVVGARYSVLSC